MNDVITYREGYKYQLTTTFEVDTGIIPPEPFDTEFIALSERGTLTIKQGYANDGPSGPTIDTPNFMAGALAHDALYQALRQGYLPDGMGYRKAADKLLKEMCILNGMSKIRATWVYLGVRLGAHPSSTQSHQRQVVIAPAKGWREVKK